MIFPNGKNANRVIEYDFSKWIKHPSNTESLFPGKKNTLFQKKFFRKIGRKLKKLLFIFILWWMNTKCT
jgi:hypothetical protein